MEYKFKDEQELDTEGKPVAPEARTIEHRGQVVTFTLNQVIGDRMLIEKKIKELKGQREHEQMKVDNVAQHHPFVADMEEADRFVVHMYQEAFSMVKACDKHLSNLEAELLKLDEDVVEIKKQIPELAAIKSPYPADDKPNVQEKTPE